MTADEFKTIRAGLGLKQRDLAQLLGYNARERVAELESGIRPVPKHLAMLMQAISDGWRPEDWPPM